MAIGGVGGHGLTGDGDVADAVGARGVLLERDLLVAREEGGGVGAVAEQEASVGVVEVLMLRSGAYSHRTAMGEHTIRVFRLNRPDLVAGRKDAFCFLACSALRDWRGGR